MIELSTTAIYSLSLGKWSISVNTDSDQNGKMITQMAKKHNCKRVYPVSFYRGKQRLTSFIINFSKIPDKEEFIAEIETFID